MCLECEGRDCPLPDNLILAGERGYSCLRCNKVYCEVCRDSHRSQEHDGDMSFHPLTSVGSGLHQRHSYL